MIGGCESAWPADLVAVPVLENAATHFRNTRCFCRDDGIAIFEGDLKKSGITGWLDGFQHNINELAGSDFLHFTASIWGSDKDDGATSNVAGISSSWHGDALVHGG